MSTVLMTLGPVTDTWAAGTSVGVWRDPHRDLRGAAPPGESLATSVVQPDGTLSFRVERGLDFVAYADGSYRRFTGALSSQGVDALADEVSELVARLPFNVMAPEYGVVADGVTDDSAALQALITAAGEGAWIHFPQGTYLVDGDLTLLEGQFVDGLGELVFADDGTAASHSLRVTADNVTIEQITLSSDASARTGVYGMVRASGCSGLKVRGVTVTGSPAAGLHLQNCTDFLLEANVISGTFADGIHMQRQCERGRVLANDISGTGDDAIGVMGYRDAGAYAACSQIVIQSNVIYDIGSGGIGRGIAVYGGRDVLVALNELEDIDACGIEVGTDISASAADATAYSKAVKVRSNQIRNAGRHASASNRTGITAAKVRGLAIDDNDVDTTGAQGIVLSGVVLEGDVTRNRVSRTTGRGIVVQQTTSTDARLLAELYTDEGETAPATAKMRVIGIVGNRVRKASDAIAVIGTSGQRIEMVSVDGNRARECSAELVDLQFVSNGSVSANIVESSGSVVGIKLDQCDGLPVLGNVVSGTTVAIQGTDFDEGLIAMNVLNGGSASVDGSSTATVGTNVA